MRETIEQANITHWLHRQLTDIAGPRIHSRPVAGLPLIHVSYPAFEGVKRVTKRTFDIVELTKLGAAGSFTGTFAFLVFGGLFLGFAVKVPMWPLHTWLPDAHTQARGMVETVEHPTIGALKLPELIDVLKHAACVVTHGGDVVHPRIKAQATA